MCYLGVLFMNETYNWLYDYYAEPQLQTLPAFSDELLEDFAKAAPGSTEIDLLDRLEALRLDWCTAAFTAGVQLGMGLLAPYARQTGAGFFRKD